jgi:hypothetical protein
MRSQSQPRARRRLLCAQGQASRQRRGTDPTRTARTVSLYAARTMAGTVSAGGHRKTRGLALAVAQSGRRTESITFAPAPAADCSAMTAMPVCARAP